MPSIFARIVSGEIPALKVFEDHETLAFMDIGPASHGHTLVICKHEYPDLFSIPPTTLSAVIHTTQQVALALREVLAPDGINVIQNNGAAAGQTVFHFHVHLIPRWDGDGALRLWQPQTADQAALRELADRLSAAIQQP